MVLFFLCFVIILELIFLTESDWSQSVLALNVLRVNQGFLIDTKKQASIAWKKLTVEINIR